MKLLHSAPFIGLASLAFLSGCGSEEGQFPITETNAAYTLEQVAEKDTLVIEEFSDIQCPACRSFSTVYEQIEKDFPEVEFRYYHYPLERIHPHAFAAAIATECAGEIAGADARASYLKGAFAKDTLSTDFFRELAVTQGLDEEAFGACFDGQKTKDIVKSHMAEGNIRGLEATPTLFFNGEKVTGGMSYDQMFAKITELQNTQAE